jgi:type III secretion protein J
MLLDRPDRPANTKPILLFTLLVFASTVSGCDAEIQHGLDEQEANRIVSELRKAGIKAEKEAEEGRDPTFTVTVSKDQAARAFQVLQALNLPRKQPKGVYELFGKTSLVPTSTEEHMKKVYATSSELAKTLERMDGVLEARVHLVLPVEGLLADMEKKPPKPRASVYVKVLPKKSVPSVGQVQKLIAGSVSNLDPSSVAVLVQPGATIDAPETDPPESAPLWLKAVAIGGCIGTLVFGLLVLLLALRVRSVKHEAEELRSGLDQDEMAGTGSQAMYRPGG